MNLPSHGANPAHLYKAAQINQPERVIDFSVNVNPSGPPPWLQDNWLSFMEGVSDYPDPDGTQARRAISERYGVPVDHLMLGNGAAELIHFLGRYAAGKRVAIVTPAFSEYEDTCRAYSCPVSYVTVDEEEWVLPVNKAAEQAKNAALLFLCSPNNPVGLSFAKQDVIDLLEKTASSGVIVVIDEAFYDFAGDETMIHELSRFSHLAVLHSMTKMYAVAGIRIGFLAASPDLIAQLLPFRPHWNVNAIALQTAERIAADWDYAEQTRQWISVERRRLKELLEGIGFQVLPSHVNFYLLRDQALDRQQPLLRFLLERGIVVRHTENFHGLNGRWLRVAVRTPAENDELLRRLKEWKRC